MTNPTANDILDVFEPNDFDNWFEDEDAPDFLQEVKEAAWNIVRENPGIDRSEWMNMLLRQYPSEVVDAYGTNPREVFHDLSDLWELEYTDPDTGDWNSFADWSDYFQNHEEGN